MRAQTPIAPGTLIMMWLSSHAGNLAPANLITIDGEFSYTSATTAVAGQGSAEPDYDSGITFDNSNQDEGVGTLRESDLQAGTIDHSTRS